MFKDFDFKVLITEELIETFFKFLRNFINFEEYLRNVYKLYAENFKLKKQKIMTIETFDKK